MKLNYRRTLLTGLAFMAIYSFWQTYDNIVPLILKNSFGMNEIITGAVMAADNVLALFLLPLFGTLSDKVNSKWGKRKPFIVVGSFLSVLAIIFMPIGDNTRNLPLFLISTGLVLLFMAFFRSPAVALMPDVTPRPLRSKGNAIINLTGTVGAIYALLMTGILVGDGKTPDYTALFWSVIIFMVVSILILMFTVNEKKWGEEAREAEKAHPELMEAEEEEQPQEGAKRKLSKPKKKSLIFLLLSVAFWYMAYNAVTSAFSRYATEVWELESGGYADCLMVATVAAIISYIPLGFLASKIGRKKSILMGVVGLFIGFLYVGFFTQYHFLINVGFVIVGISWGAINVNSFPMVVEIANDGDVGKYTGYYYVFSMAAQILTPVLSGALLQWVSYTTLFPYSCAFSIFAFLTMLMVKHGDTKPMAKKSVLENFDIDD
ncbi:MAG: SLC45 family MFS transporter [Lachnospiraceae bacterium]|nr:SLC45 family MFS transporter [Lachnospiraceae bacterium]